MANARSVSSDHRSQVHTEVRAPVEVVVSRIIMYAFGVIEVFIGVRFVLMLLGANAEAGFVKMVYGVSGVFMAPFITIFDTQKVDGAIFEWSALVAIAVYALVAWGLTALIHALSPRSQSQTVERVESKDDGVAQQ
jgi:hypothetical protein